jgi:adenylate cyclase
MAEFPGAESMTPEELERLGVFDPSALDASDRLTLLQEAVSLGASQDELVKSTNVGELVMDLTLRPRLDTTIAEAVAEDGLDWAQAERLLRALGLPSDPAARLTSEERVAIAVLARAVSDLLGFESTLQLSRAAGGAMATVAEALVTATRLRFELPRLVSGTPYAEVVKQYTELAETMLPDFVRALDAALRRQIIGVSERMWAADPEREAIVLPRTVGFADLVGYTAAAEKLSARELTAVLMEFDELTSSIVVGGGGGQIVKTIGDEVMFVTDDPQSACRVAARLVSSFGHGMLPPVRVGLAEGTVVSVFGDIYGAVVNLAARLVEAAGPSSVLVSRSVSEACSAEFAFDSVPPLNLHGIAEPVLAARMITEL